MIQVNGLVKTFDGHKALDGLDIHIRKGSIYGLVGVNGSGKTTVIKHLAGVYRQDGGTAQINGADVYDNAEVKKLVGFIPDELYFFPQYNMKRTRNFFKEMYASWNDERFQRLTSLFKLDGKRKINGFSKGMQKQAAFAFVMSSMPDVLLLDEPIDGLDPIVRKLVMKEIIDDVAEREMTVLISSHNLKEMDGICDAIGIIKNGKMIIERDLDDLKSDVHKIQIALPEENAQNAQAEPASGGTNGEPGAEESTPHGYTGLQILHSEKRGSINLWVVRGKEEDVRAKVESLRPLVYDHLPLTLEEIFIYETEGADNEIFA